MEMRRKDREITDPAKIEDILRRCICCRIGFWDKGEVYIVPLHFGYIQQDDKQILYFHSAQEGRKIQLLQASPQVGFEMDTHYLLHEAETACGYSARFQSIIGNGVAELVTDPAEKLLGLTLLMQHNTGKSDWTFEENMVKKTAIFKLTITQMRCKEHL